MIGFRDQSTIRRPIYSATGIKLGYLVSGPDGEWWTTVKGKRIGRIKQFRRPKLPEVGASASGTYINLDSIDA